MNANVHGHFAKASKVLQAAVDDVKELYKAHKPTSGHAREELVAKFFEDHLPKAFGVGTGLIVSSEGVFSNQADIFVFDQIVNAPLHAGTSERLCTVESVYALIEVKAYLSPSELEDALSKCRRFKRLKRQFAEFVEPKLTDSLFVIFAFGAAESETFAQTFSAAVKSIPQGERPDFVIVPGGVVGISGHYFEVSQLGDEGSIHRQKLIEGGELERKRGNGMKLYPGGEHSLFAFFGWLTSWLQRAGRRGSEMSAYTPPQLTVGEPILIKDTVTGARA